MACPRRVLALVALAASLVAADATAQGKCRLLKVVEWPVRIVADHIVVDGAINGQAVAIMLDTGATVSAIDTYAASRLDLPRREAPGRRVVGVGGVRNAQIALVDDFKLGEDSARSLQLLVVGDGSRRSPWDVTLGEDFLQRFDVEFDLAHDAVRLFQPKDCENASLAYWAKANVAEVEIESLRDAAPGIAFTVKLNDRPVDAMLDSGAAVSVVSLQDAEALGITPQSPGVTPAGSVGGLGAKRVDLYAALFRTFAMGNESIPDIRIAFGDLWKDTAVTSTGSNVGKRLAPTRPMIVGGDFLRAHRMLVSHSQRRLYFAYVGGPVFRVLPAPRAAPASAQREEPGPAAAAPADPAR